MNESEFQLLADTFLTSLEETLEEADASGILDVEGQNGSLTLALPSGKQWLISKHTPNRQIWLASPITGGLHFSYDAIKKQWVLPDGRDILAILAEEIKALGQIDIGNL